MTRDNPQNNRNKFTILTALSLACILLESVLIDKFSLQKSSNPPENNNNLRLIHSALILGGAFIAFNLINSRNDTIENNPPQPAPQNPNIAQQNFQPQNPPQNQNQGVLKISGG